MKKKRLKKYTFKSAMAVTFAALFLAMTGCGSDPFYIRIVSIEGVPETGTAGTPLALTGTVRPAFASNTNIIWSVKDAGTTGASISGNILNTAAVGKVTIRATVTDGKAEGKDYTQDFLINMVEGSTGGGETVSVTGITLSPTTLTLTAGNTAILTPIITPDKATNINVTWSSSNANVATVSNGTVTAVAVGTATITVTTADGGFTAECVVTVNDATFTTTADIKAWLGDQPDNTADNPYHIALNVDDLGGAWWDSGSIGNALYGNSGKYVFLDLSGSTITSIGEGAFEGCKNLTGIIIPNSVTSIGNWAFDNCINLTNLNIPASVTSIGNSVFDFCFSLTAITVDSGNKNYTSDQGVLYNKNKTVIIQYPAGKAGVSFVIPNSVTNIGDNAFVYSANLTSIIIPNSVNSIEKGAFHGCTSLISVTIPNGVNSIEDFVFFDCTNLTSVNIPNSVNSIGYGAFRNCTSLIEIAIPDSVNSIGLSAFYDCKNLTNVTIGNSVNSIKSLAFAGCTSLTSIIIPDSVNSIEDWVFGACHSLTCVIFEGTIASSELDIYAFGETTSLAYIGDLCAKYLDGGPGTYTRPSTTSLTWSKQ
ncbi:leucine-rich repeat protein [Treponema sp. R80B11-R83G3]